MNPFIKQEIKERDDREAAMLKETDPKKKATAKRWYQSQRDYVNTLVNS